MKSLIVLMLVAVLVALAGAGFLMLRRGQEDGERNPKAMARALAIRVGLSIGVFLIVLLAWLAGWIRPTGLPLG